MRKRKSLLHTILFAAIVGVSLHGPSAYGQSRFAGAKGSIRHAGARQQAGSWQRPRVSAGSQNFQRRQDGIYDRNLPGGGQSRVVRKTQGDTRRQDT